MVPSVFLNVARPLRLQFANALYHITARGNRKGPIFLATRDRVVFLHKLDDTIQKYAFKCYAYCLMGNHYHLLIRTLYPNLSLGMHHLNTAYANWYKAKHGIVGVVFQGRYKAILVEEEVYARTLAAYIHLNPVRAGIVEEIMQYPWSSYPSLVLDHPSRLKGLDTGFILSMFSKDKREASKAFGKYVRESARLGSPFTEVRGGCILGSKEFAEGATEGVRAGGRIREIPATRMPPAGPVAGDLLLTIIAGHLGIEKGALLRQDKRSIYKQIALYVLDRHTHLKLREIGEIFGMDYAAVHAAVRRLERRRGKEMEVDRLITSFEQLRRSPSPSALWKS